MGQGIFKAFVQNTPDQSRHLTTGELRTSEKEESLQFLLPRFLVVADKFNYQSFIFEDRRKRE